MHLCGKAKPVRLTSKRLDNKTAASCNTQDGFEASPSRETSAIFLDLSKAFKWVWLVCLLCKFGIQWYSWKLYDFDSKLFKIPKQRVLLNGKSSSVPHWMSGQHKRVIANVCCQVRVELTISLVRNNSDLENEFH